MKNTFFSTIKTITDKYFLVDSHGRTIFFPNGNSGTGYVLNNPEIQDHYARFYAVSLAIYIIVLFFLLSFAHSLGAIIAFFLVPSALWLLVNTLYAKWVTRSLPKAKDHYNEMILKAITSAASNSDEEDITSTDFPIYHRPLYPPPPLKPDRFIKLKIFFTNFSSGSYGIYAFFMGCIIFGIWSSIHPVSYTGHPEENLLIFLVTFFWGLSGFLYFNDEASEWGGFRRNSKEGSLLIMVIFWGMALVSLYLFMSQTIHISLPQFCPPTTWICQPLSPTK